MTTLTALPLYRATIERELRNFCGGNSIRIRRLRWEGESLRLDCANDERTFVERALTAIQNSTVARHCYAYYANANPGTPSLPYGYFSVPLARRLEEIGRERSDELRWAAAERARQRAASKRKNATPRTNRKTPTARSHQMAA